MARLETVGGGWLELTPIAFEFDRGDPYNWLRLELCYEFGEARRRPTVDPALTMSEARGLVRWLRKILDRGLEVGERFLGIEPNLQFRLVSYAGRGVRLEVWFELEWAPRPHVPQPIEVGVTPADLRRFADELEMQLLHLSAGNLQANRRPEIWRRGSSRRRRLP